MSDLSAQSDPDGQARSANEASQGAFNLLAPGLQRQLWRMGWKELRPLQAKAIRTIIQTDKHVILSAATASGKTEAAFLPMLSCIADQPLGAVRILYVGPLKALINDQFRRVEELCEYLEVPTFRWHGDVSAAHKVRLVDKPGGVLLITPESLESLFVNRSVHLGRLFDGLRFVVIDELHSFLDNERGLHLRSLLRRLSQFTGRQANEGTFRMAGLSATIGDYTVAKQFIQPDRPDDVMLIDDSGDTKEIKYRIHGYRMPALGPSVPAGPGETSTGNDEERRQKQLESFQREIARDIVTHCRRYGNLVFANSRAAVEEFSDLANQIATAEKIADPFLVHHGSLSGEIREDAEAVMKSGRAATTFCSSTLEMGIDIGSVRMVGQIGPSWSVSSQLQRMGRSGRHTGQPRIMRLYIECLQADADDDVLDRLNLPLVQAVAISELMLRGWMERRPLPRGDLSTLAHQVISVISQTGGLRADALYDRLCARGAFRETPPDQFAMLLRQLGSRDVIEQMEGGDLILGLLGEKLRRDRGFYAVFPTAQEYSILHDGRLLGSLETAPLAGEHLLFAGKRWLVTDVDEERHEIHVIPARGWKRPEFTGGAGEVDPMIRQTMREILDSDTTFAYLDKQAASLLAEAQKAAREAGVCRQPLVALGPKKTAFMTWTGTRIQHTLAAMCRRMDVSFDDRGVALVFGMTIEQTGHVLRELAAAPPAPVDTARAVFPRLRRKYDWLLGDDLLDVSLAEGFLDIQGALKLIENTPMATSDLPSPSPADRLTAGGGAIDRRAPLARVRDSVPAEPVAPTATLFFDTETSDMIRRGEGPGPRQPHIVQLAALLVGAGQETHMCVLVRPEGWVVSPGAEAVHGISTAKAMAEGVSLREAIEAFDKLAAQAGIVVAHNIDFDRIVILSEYVRLGMGDPFTGKREFCTMKSTTAILKLPGPYGYKWPKLEEAYRHFTGKALDKAHDALADVRACRVIYEALVGRRR